MDPVGVAGLFVSLGGFAVALWQLQRTHRAAEAARAAAAEAVRAVQHVQAVATVQDICGRSRDLLHLTRARNLAAAATAAFELRDALARFQATDSGQTRRSAELWLRTLSSVESVHECLESAAVTSRLDAAEREAVIHEIARVHSHLSSLAAHTAAIGGQDANSG